MKRSQRIEHVRRGTEQKTIEETTGDFTSIIDLFKLIVMVGAAVGLIWHFGPDHALWALLLKGYLKI